MVMVHTVILSMYCLFQYPVGVTYVIVGITLGEFYSLSGITCTNSSDSRVGVASTTSNSILVTDFSSDARDDVANATSIPNTDYTLDTDGGITTVVGARNVDCEGSFSNITVPIS